MRTTTILVELPMPYAAMLALEARGSGRTVASHVRHILGRRYDNLIRVCGCAYFIYAATDDLRCERCGAACCPFCSSPQDECDECFTCLRARGLDTAGLGGVRAAPEGKV